VVPAEEHGECCETETQNPITAPERNARGERKRPPQLAALLFAGYAISEIAQALDKTLYPVVPLWLGIEPPIKLIKA
jgi:hypothetical protein